MEILYGTIHILSLIKALINDINKKLPHVNMYLLKLSNSSTSLVIDQVILIYTTVVTCEQNYCERLFEIYMLT